MAYEFECKKHPLPCSAPSCICPRKEIKLCPFCGDNVKSFPNNGHAHYDCARDFEIENQTTECSILNK